MKDKIRIFFEIFDLAIKTPFFSVVIILNVISSFLTILGIPLLIPALQYLNQSETKAENEGIFINFLNIFFDFFKIEISFYSIIFLASSLIFFGQLILLLIELFSKKIHIFLVKKYMTELVNRYYKINWTWMLNDKSGKFQSAISREIIPATEAHLDSLRLITNIIQICVYVYAAFIISVSGSLYSILFFIIAVLINLIFTSKLKLISKKNNVSNINLLTLINSLILNKKFLKSSKNFDSFSTHIKKEIYNVTQTDWKLALIDGSLRTFTYLLGLAFMIFIFIMHPFLKITFNEIIILLLVFSRLIPTFSISVSSFNRVIEKLPIYNSVKLRLDELKNNEEIFGVSKPNFNKDIIFKDVYFEYEKNQIVLNKINFKIKSFSTNVLIGQSGSGKSTFLDLFMGLLKPNEGEIFIGEENFSEINLDNYRQNIAYVSQDTTLLDGSLLFNFKIVNEKVTEKEIYEICKKVQIYDFISNLPDKLNTKVGENGTRLSGGQKQRIALARAFLSNPKILVLDEATSNLDHETEASIISTIKSFKNKITILIVTHRFTILNDVDNVYLIKDREINRLSKADKMSKEK